MRLAVLLALLGCTAADASAPRVEQVDSTHIAYAVAPVVAWRATCGTVDSTGLWTAPATPGVCLVIAAVGDSADTAVATVQAPLAQGCPTSGYTRLVDVSTSAALTAALTAALPGDQIRMAPGTYAVQLTLTHSGTVAQPIQWCGPRTAIVTAAPTVRNLTLRGSYWWLRGFRMTAGYSIMHIEGGHWNLLDSLELDHSQYEMLAFQNFSTHNRVQDSELHDAGVAGSAYSEGVYVGTSGNHWSWWSPTLDPDRSDSNEIVGNTITVTSAENIDVKEGTTGTLIQGNTLGPAGAAAGTNLVWVAIRGNGARVLDNTGSGGPSSGFQIYGSTTPGVPLSDYLQWGNNTTFRRNVSQVAGGSGFLIQAGHTGNVIGCDNTVTGGVFGVTCQP